jgi:tellurite resistance protein
MPPAVFPAILGLLWLGMAWRKAAAVFALPQGLVDACLGAVTLLWAFSVFAYAAKALRRPAVMAEDLRILPGRDGLAALALTFPAVALVLVPTRPGLASGLILAGLAVHVALIALAVRVLVAGPPEARGVTPVWQTMFAGLAMAALPALDLGWTGPAVAGAILSALAAAMIGLVSASQLIRRIPPAPLRPLLALHLFPVAVLGLVAQGLGLVLWAQALALMAAALLLALAASGRLLLPSGYTPFLGALIYPLAACGALFLALDGPWRIAGALLVLAATMGGLPIIHRLLQDGIKGRLAQQTNAAEA